MTLDIFQSDLRPMEYWYTRASDKLGIWATGEPEGYSTGFKDIDAYTHLIDSDLLIIAGRPSMGKCLGRGTRVLLYDGTLKTVEDVEVGDQLMGPDSTPRNVLSLARGKEMMYWVRQKQGVDYRVNASHILSLKRSKNEGKWHRGDTRNFYVSDVARKGPGFYARWKGYKVAVEFREKPVPVDPYFVGLWLGDGKSDGSQIYTMDTEVVGYLKELASDRGDTVTVGDTQRACQSYRVSTGKGGSHKKRAGSLQGQLSEMGLLKNKHIPDAYLRNCRAVRLGVLAGLIDSDGHYMSAQNGPYEITAKDYHLAEQIKFLCDSLGYRTSLNSKLATIAETGYECEVYRVRFNGNVDEIPARVERKKAAAWTDFRDWQVTGISVEQDIVDDYFGFVLDGDHLFLLEDMTVTHNTALGMQMMEHVATQVDDGVVAVFSAEMAGWALYMRMAAAICGVNTHKLRSGKGTPDEVRKLRDAMETIKTRPIWIDDNSGPTTDQMLEQLSRLNDSIPVRAMLFDFMELGGDRAQNENIRVGQIAHNLKGIAKTLGIPVVALSQLNRDVENRANKMPTLADLRYSGMIEQIADVVMFVMRPEYYEERQMTVDVPEVDKKGVAYVQIAKHRNGPAGLVKLAYQGDRIRFANLAIERHNLNGSAQ